MLAGFRTFAKSPLAVILFALLIVSFAVFGISDVFKGPRLSGVVQAGSRTLTPQDFKVRFDSYRKGTERQTGEAITPDQAVERGIDRQILDEIALQESIAEAISRAGINPSDKLIGDVVRQQMSALHPNQRPFDPITGSAQWGLVKAGDRIVGIHSLSESQALKTAFAGPDSTFSGATRYEQWVFRFEPGEAVR